MSKWLKILAALLSLPLLGAGALAFLVDPDAYRDEVRAAFSAATGRDLVIAGHLRVSLVPRPVVEMTRASVPGAPGTEGPPLAEVDLVRLYPRIAPLFSGRLEWDLVRARGLRVALIRDAQGRASWETGRARSPRVGAWEARGVSLEEGRSAGWLGAFAAESRSRARDLVIGRVEILDSRVIWDDRRRERRLELEDLDVFAGPIAPPEPIALRITGSLREGAEGPPAALRGEGTLRIDAGARRLELAPLVLGVDGVGLGEGLAANLLLRTGLTLEQEARRYLADDLSLEVHAFGPVLSGPPIDAKIRARLALDLGAERLNVRDLTISSGNLSARGGALGQSLLSAPVLTGDLTVDELDLRAWLAPLGLPLPPAADPETFRRVSLDTCWRLEQGQLGLYDLRLRLDEAEIGGEVERISAGRRAYRFDLLADRLDLDRYLPPMEDSSPAAPPTSQWHGPAASIAALPVGRRDATEAMAGFFLKTAAASAPAQVREEIQLPVAAIRKLTLKGRLRIGELRLARLRFGDTDLHLRADGGSLDMDNRAARFYEGLLDGRLSLNLQGAEPRLALVQRAEGIQVGGLLADLGWGDRLIGRGEVSTNLVSTGSSMAALRRNLAGTLAIHVTEGALTGINLERMVREAEARLRGKPPPADLPMQTDIKELRASAELEKGVLSSRDLVATADHLRVTGAGTLDLDRRFVDYRFEPVFVKPPRGRGIKELEGIPIPVQLTGPLEHPSWEVDVGRALRAAAERRLESRGGDLLKDLEERTGIKGLENGLKRLFGR